MAYAVLRCTSSMVPDLGMPPSGVGSAAAPEEIQAIRALVLQVAAQATLARATELLSTNLARFLNAPLALLSRDPLSWRFEAHAFPESPSNGALMKFPGSHTAEDPVRQLQEDSGHAWTAIALGTLGDRDWALLLPGQSGTWASRPGFEQLVEDIGWSLGQVASRERADYDGRFRRKLHAFTHRLARTNDSTRLHALVLRTLASAGHSPWP